MEKMMAAAQIKSYEFGMINGIMDSVTNDFKWLHYVKIKGGTS